MSPAPEQACAAATRIHGAGRAGRCNRTPTRTAAAQAKPPASSRTSLTRVCRGMARYARAHASPATRRTSQARPRPASTSGLSAARAPYLRGRPLPAALQLAGPLLDAGLAVRVVGGAGVAGGVQGLGLLVREVQPGGAQVVPELVDRAGAEDHRRHARPVVQPRERDLGHRDAAVL